MATGGRGLRGARRAVALTFGLLLLGLSAMGFQVRSAAAQDWVFGSKFTQTGTYNSNLLLNPDNKISAFGSISVPEFKLERSGPTSKVVLGGKFTFAEYIDHSSLNSQDQNGTLSIDKELSERSKLGLEASVDRDSTLTSDRDITGRFLNRPVHFVAFDVAPFWSYDLSPIDQIRLSPSFSAVNYADSPVETDYRIYGGNLAYSHSLSELTQVTGNLSYYRFEPDDTQNSKTDIYGGLVGYRYTPSERLLLDGAVGLNYKVRTTDGSSGSGSSSDVGYRLKFNATYAIDDQTKARLALSRDEEPSGNGRTITRNRASIALSYQLSELTVLNLDASYADNEKIGGSSTQSSEGTSRYFSLKPSATWQITDRLSFAASYQFRHKRSDGGSATDNAAFITLRYSLQDQHWSGF